MLTKTIDLAALRHNWRQIRRKARAAQVIAVLKSNAYGHGLTACADTLAANSTDGTAAADGIALATLSDARLLRRRGISLPLLMLQGFARPPDAARFAELRLTPVIHSAWQLQALATLPAAARLPVYLKINTGMNRLGFAPADATAALATLQNTPAVAGITLMTHFADADTRHGLKKPLAQLDPWRTAGLPLSLGNSAATLLHGDIGDNIARVGIALYGASPAPAWQDRDTLGLQPVMTLTTNLIARHTVPAGARIGYGGDYTASKKTPIGIAAVGYGDGYPRRQGLTATIKNAPAPVIGRVSMEMTALDLTAAPTAAIGDQVTLWGAAPPIDAIATAAETIAYDLLTNITAKTTTRRSSRS